jgi:dTDP-4-dehydrorhamnose reductase
MQVLVLGGGGQVGTELRALLRPPDIDLVCPPRSIVDLEHPNALADIIAAQPWRAVINASGYTDVDGAEKDQKRAFRINADAVSQLAMETKKREIPVIHISTDYVFNGKTKRPYLESDDPAPLNIYGKSKLAGEQALQRGNPRHIILRTSWVYSPHGKNFVKTILRLAQTREQLSVVADQRGCPTAARDIAKISLELALTCVRQPKGTPYGLYHCAGALEATWFDFATAIVDLARKRLGRMPKVTPLRTDEYPTVAIRPADSRLDSSALSRAFNFAADSWRTALPKTIEQLLSQED